MSQALARIDPSPAWSIRAFSSLPLPIAGTGLLLFGVWGALALAWNFALVGSANQLVPSYAAFELLNAIFIAFAPSATAWSIVAADRDLRDLRPVLSLSDDEFAATERSVLTFSRKALAAASAVGIGCMLFGVFVPDPGDLVVWPEGRPAFGSATMNWILLRGAVLWGLLARTVYVDLALARRFSRLGERVAQVDVLDPKPLAPFATRGLRSVLLWMLLILLNSLLLLVPFAKSTAAVNMLALGVLAAVLLFLPARGIHRRMREARDAELARVRESIRDERRTLLDAEAGKVRGHGRLADLVAYEDRVSRSATWPFDVSTWLRFGLYVALGAGSWLGAALVERVVERALG